MRPNEPRHDGARDPRWAAPEIGMDLSRIDIAIDEEIRRRWPDPGVWWELEPGDQAGWVYSDDNHILAKLVHVTPGVA